MLGIAPKLQLESRNRNWAPPLKELHNSPPVQTKLEIGKPGDKYEQEADQMADQVMMAPYDRSKMVMMAPNPDNPTLRMAPMPKSNMIMMAGHPGKPMLKTSTQVQKNEVEGYEGEEDMVQMECKACAEKEMVQRDMHEEVEDDMVQTKCAACEEKDTPDVASSEGMEEKIQQMPAIQKAENGTTHASPELTSSISSTKGQGSPLPKGTMQELGTKMGADFSSVSIHTGSNAVQMNQDLGAKAFTHGSDIYFNKGNYSPESSSGKHLLAHELTHTIQQGRSNVIQEKAIKKEDLNKWNGEIIPWSTPLYQEADGSSKRLIDIKRGIQVSVVEDSGVDWVKVQVTHDGEVMSGYVGRAQLKYTGSALDQPSEGITAKDFPWKGATLVQGTGFNKEESTKNKIADLPKDQPVLVVGQNDRGTWLKVETIVDGTNRVGYISHELVSFKQPEKIGINFRASAISLLSCAPCNPFTDDGKAKALTPPSTEFYGKESYRQKHILELSASSDDLVHINSSAISTNQSAGTSHYCDEPGDVKILRNSQAGITSITRADGVEGIMATSLMETRVNAWTPPTLPGAPCGGFGDNNMVPAIHAAFVAYIYADGERGSFFQSASPYPYHYLYEDKQLKQSGGKPVQPGANFKDWATSTGVKLPLAKAGFVALRQACCTKKSTGAYPQGVGNCKTYCVGGFSVPKPSKMNLAYCAVEGVSTLFSKCPASCASKANDKCTPEDRTANNPSIKLN